MCIVATRKLIYRGCRLVIVSSLQATMTISLCNYYFINRTVFSRITESVKWYTSPCHSWCNEKGLLYQT